MAKVSKSKSRMFLAELMIDVLFFTVAAAICLTIFARAYTMSQDSREKSRAMVYAQQGAECFKSSGEEGLLAILGARQEGDCFMVYYDKDWEALGGIEGSTYVMQIFISRLEGMATAQVSVSSQKSQIFGIEVKKYEG